MRNLSTSKSEMRGGRNRKEGTAKLSDVGECLKCVYRVGMGLSFIASRFAVNKNTARKLFIRAQIYRRPEERKVSRPVINGRVAYAKQAHEWVVAIAKEYARERKILRQDFWWQEPESKRWLVNRTARSQYRRAKEEGRVYHIARKLRSRIHKALKLSGCRKQHKTVLLIGCSFEELKQHIEKQFQPGMHWDNWCLNGWHIDHIRPCASFDLSCKEQQKECFHFKNMRPIWAKDNWSKGPTFDGRRWIKNKRHTHPLTEAITITL
jgi:hypothetical protein